MSQDLTILTDLYQLTMMQAYFSSNKGSKRVVFDFFYRTNPSYNTFSISCGLEQVISYIKNIKFEDEDIEYLRTLELFDEEFLTYLKDFKFTGNIYSLKEGDIMFPLEPILRVEAPILEAQFIETTILNITNHQSLIATKATRVVWAAGDDDVLEFGLRRAQGPDAGLYGARAAFIGGCVSTSNILAGKMFDIPVCGTHAHSWIMSFDSEYDAFREYARIFPKHCILLVDTYDTVKQGIPNAIKVFNELKDAGIDLNNYGIRLDSGDLSYLSIKARTMLDEAGFTDAVICASSDLDEYLITNLKRNDSKITVWGVGTNMITSSQTPALGGVYKLVAEYDDDGNEIPKIKISNNMNKSTNPGVKKIVRIYDKETGKLKYDIIALKDEVIDNSKTLEYQEFFTRGLDKSVLEPFTYEVVEMLQPIFIDGECVYESPPTVEIREYCKQQLATLVVENRGFEAPAPITVELSPKLLQLKREMTDKAAKK